MIKLIIDELYSKGNIIDNDFLKAVYKLHKNYFIVRPKMNSEVVKFINNFNSTFGQNIKISTFKNTPIGFTVEEMFLKALAFNPKNPLEFMADHALFIPKNELVFEYLDSIKTYNILINNSNSKESISNKVKLFTTYSQGRIVRQFYTYINKKFPNFIATNNRFPNESNGRFWFDFEVIYDTTHKELNFDVYRAYLGNNKQIYDNFINDINSFMLDIDNNKNPKYETYVGRIKYTTRSNCFSFPNCDVAHNLEIETSSYVNPHKASMLHKACGKKGKIVSCASIETGLWINEDSFYRIAFL